MTQTAIHKKLRFQPGQTALVINCPQAYAELLGALPEEVDFIQAASGTADFVHLFVRNRAELEKYIDTALSAIQYDGLLWISYPKGAAKVETDLNRDSL